MKLTLITVALAVSSAAAFAPSSVERTSSALNMDRRSAFGQIATASAVLAGVPAIASADGAASAQSEQRARFKYGSRIIALQKAVDSGDFGAIADEKAAFILFNSGAYSTNKAKRKAAVAGTNAIFAAIRSGDKGAVKSAFGNYVADNKIKDFVDVSPDDGQGYCNDFDYRVKTKSAAIYVR
mmetsp:Transcript_13931/g.16930  ORF Transcript_13931/g.16930 Transcript_13931/m.16930 type:complete len:182 (+) Transcript_13931:71-616(+)